MASAPFPLDAVPAHCLLKIIRKLTMKEAGRLSRCSRRMLTTFEENLKEFSLPIKETTFGGLMILDDPPGSSILHYRYQLCYNTWTHYSMGALSRFHGIRTSYTIIVCTVGEYLEQIAQKTDELRIYPIPGVDMMEVIPFFVTGSLHFFQRPDMVLPTPFQLLEQLARRSYWRVTVDLCDKIPLDSFSTLLKYKEVVIWKTENSSDEEDALLELVKALQEDATCRLELFILPLYENLGLSVDGKETLKNKARFRHNKWEDATGTEFNTYLIGLAHHELLVVEKKGQAKHLCYGYKVPQLKENQEEELILSLLRKLPKNMKKLRKKMVELGIE